LARKILLADDSVTAQNMGRRILTDAGYDVTTVNNGSAALKKIAESKPDLIILDVYMPGYGGLELCQRLREAPETARIPVLLTVGKLEPFKADDSRRVRADGFIVKPFEASELLTALAKLEDKIVPQGQPQKVSRFAKAMAAADESVQSKEYGDSETGWKNRLSIPPPHSKPRDAQSDEPSTTATSSREATQVRESTPPEMKSGLEEALLSSLPQDVTPEEIAAIKAAAAAFNLPMNEARPPEPAHEHAESTNPPVAQEAAETVASAEKETGAVTFASSPESQSESVPASISAEMNADRSALADKNAASETTQPAPMAVDSTASAAPQTTEASDLGDEEVTAALAYLAPSNGHEAATAITQESAIPDTAVREQIPVTMAAGVAQEFGGPRWIAESVGLMENESSLVLEQEMQQAFASFAAADAARLSFASAPNPSFVATEPEAAISEPATSPVESSASSNNSESVSLEPAQTIVPSVEVSTAVEVHSVEESASTKVDAASESGVPEIKEDVALAAAAGQGSAESTTAAESAQTVAQSSENSTLPESAERHGESELAAAWANWKHIRETVLGSQVGPQIAESAIAEPKEVHADVPPNESESHSAQEPSTHEETEEISNIVDSVLADLKPKLMQEIARKMGKESKKK
jgi:CheY-like chemotaxis protein